MICETPNGVVSMVFDRIPSVRVVLARRGLIRHGEPATQKRQAHAVSTDQDEFFQANEPLTKEERGYSAHRVDPTRNPMYLAIPVAGHRGSLLLPSGSERCGHLNKRTQDGNCILDCNRNRVQIESE